MNPWGRDADPDSLVSFSPHLPEELPSKRRAELLERVEELRPWMQGPFYFGGDLVINGPWNKHRRWEELRNHIPSDLSSVRVLDVGTNAGFDSFMFKTLGAEYVMGCEPSVFYEHAEFLESVYRSGVDFQRIGRQDLSPERHGQFAWSIATDSFTTRSIPCSCCTGCGR